MTTITNLASGIIRVDSNVPGPNMLIIGGIHGNEPCGVYAIEKFLAAISSSELELKKGSVTLIIGNEEALKQKKRCINYNLNRLFLDQVKSLPDYEHQRAEVIKPYIKAADYVLDLHSTSSPTEAFVFAEESYQSDALGLGLRHVVLGWNTLTDIDLGGDTETYGRKHGTKSITVECGQHDDAATSQTAYQTLLSFLSKYGIAKQQQASITPESKLYRMFKVEKLAGDGFQYLVPATNFSSLRAGQVIGQDSQKTYIAPIDCILIMPGQPQLAALGEEIYFLGRAV